MKIFVALIMMILSVTDLSARESGCIAINSAETSVLKSLGVSAEGINCMATRNQYKCGEIENDLEASEKYKVIKCDSKSLEANRLGNVSLIDCVWNGFKISGESLVDIVKLPGALAEQIAKGFQETQFCNTSVDKKREILTAFNLTIEDPRFRIDEKMLGRFLNDASCAEIEKIVFNRYQNYQNTIMRERIAAINSGRKPAPLTSSESEKSGPSLGEMLKKAMAQVEGTYQCYTPKVKAEMICAGVTSLLADAALGGGISMAVKKMGAVVKSARALSKIKNATSSGQAVDLADAAILLERERIKAAAVVLKQSTPFSEAQKAAITAAHEIGKKEGRGFYEYTTEDLLKKARILREAGFNPEQTRRLMETGVTGAFRNDATIRTAMISYMDKVLKVSTTVVQQESLIQLHELGFSSAKGFAEKAQELLKKAGFNDDQIQKILKAKLDNEKGLVTAASISTANKREAEAAILAAKKESERVAAEKATAARTVAATPPAQPAVSAARQAVLNNFKSDPLINYKFVEIPEGATAEVLEAKTNARRMSAQKFLTEMDKKGATIQDTIFDSGDAIRKSKMGIKEAEEGLSKLPATASDLKRKELMDKLERSKTSYEMYQQRCKTVVDLYRVGYGIQQFLKQYEKDYEYNCN